jgi:hypothetical protein
MSSTESVAPGASLVAPDGNRTPHPPPQAGSPPALGDDDRALASDPPDAVRFGPTLVLWMILTA